MNERRTAIPTHAQRHILGFQLASWRRARGEGMWVLAGQVSAAVAGVVGVRVLTELAPKDVLGEATLLLGLLAVGRSIFLTPIVNTQIRFYPEYAGRGQLHYFVTRVERFAVMATLLFFVFAIPAYLVWRRGEPTFQGILLLALAVAFVAEALKAVKTVPLNCERRQRAAAVWAAAEGLLLLGVTSAFLLLSKSVEGYVLGQAAAMLISAVVFGLVLFRQNYLPDTRLPPGAGRELWQKVVSYGMPFVPLAIVSWVSNLGDRYILGSLMGAEQVGLYAAAYGLANRPFLLIGGAFASFARPILFAAQSDGHHDKAARVFRLWLLGVAAVGLLGVAAFWLLGNVVAGLLLAEPYRQGAPAVLLWVAMGYAIMTVTQVLEVRYMSLRGSRGLIWPTTAAAVANVAFNFILIPRFGVVGAAQSTAIAFAFQCLLLAQLMATRPRRSVPS